MIKILFIHNKLVFGGAEQALFDLLSLMDKTLFDITLLVQYDGGIWESKFKEPGCTPISIWECQKNSRNPLVKLHNRYKRKKISKAIINNGKNLLKTCLNKQFDIIVAYNGSTLQHMSFNNGAKTVKYIHGDVGSNSIFRNDTAAIVDTIRKFDRVICVSYTAKRSFESCFGTSENVVHHYNPLNSENVLALSNEELSLPNNTPYICAVGRLSPEKGYDRLIRIHKHLINEGFPHQLIIVGDGPEKNSLIQLIIDENVEDSVEMVGYQINPYPFIKHSKFLVCSSYTEGLPVIAMEALSLGVPIVSSAPSVAEAFGDEACGLITQNDDVSLESGIRRMLVDDEFYTIAKQGAAKRSAFFDGKRMVKEVEEEFISLVNQSK